MRGLKQTGNRFTIEIGNVAPLAGAWIETRLRSQLVQDGRHVAPLAGAWIETSVHRPPSPQGLVAPLAGAWIETRRKRRSETDGTSRTPRGCVD